MNKRTKLYSVDTADWRGYIEAESIGEVIEALIAHDIDVENCPIVSIGPTAAATYGAGVYCTLDTRNSK